MNKSDHNPYHYGGAVDRKKYIYVETDAHQQLYKSLKAGQLCCVFNARKAGKTSLKNGIMSELLKDGYKCISLDISMNAAGDTTQTMDRSMDRWYYSFLTGVARQLNIKQIKDSPLNKWWNEEQKYLNSIDKVTIFFEDEVLSSCQHKIIIFIDELEYVKQLPFSTDGFFTWIRGIYQKKASLTININTNV